MDTFKLLSRSTNLKQAYSSSRRRDSKHVPSSGTAKTPQLFPEVHSISDEIDNPEGQVKGRKRKREVESTPPPATDPSDLNFFKSLPPPHSSVPYRGTESSWSHSRTSSRTLRPLEESNPIGRELELEGPLSGEECRRILKAHKIQIADISDTHHDPISVTVKSSSKRLKGRRSQKNALPEISKKKQNEAHRLYPQPLTSFHQLRSRYQISSRLFANLQSQGYSVPTEVQLGSLPFLLEAENRFPHGKSGNQQDPRGSVRNKTSNLLTVAPTGSGKTLSFFIPLINSIVNIHRQDPSGSTSHGTISIIVAPTKELANQIVNEGRKLTAGTGVKIAVMRKGMKILDRDPVDTMSEDEEHDSDSKDSDLVNPPKPEHGLKAGEAVKCDILVTTPLLIVNALSANKTAEVTPLPSMQYLILDEADVLLDPLFRDQTLSIWKACTNPQLRVSLWSATMGSNIEELARSTILKRCKTLSLPEDTSLLRLVVGLKDSAVPNVSHKLVYAATERGKLLGLRQLLHPAAMMSTHLRPPFLVFTQTIPRAIALHSELLYDIPAEAGGPSRIAVLHSDLSDTVRSNVMTRFRKGEIWVLITTDLLSRGVDFRGINGVVNYDIPNSSAAYVHRIGRTGRAGREGGVAITFYTMEDIPYVKNIANVIAVSAKQQGEKSAGKMEKWLLDALPRLSKNDKKELKRRGVEARRSVSSGDRKGGKENRRMRISTKSGFERRLEHNRKGGIWSKGAGKEKDGFDDDDDSGADEEEWAGLDD